MLLFILVQYIRKDNLLLSFEAITQKRDRKMKLCGLGLSIQKRRRDCRGVDGACSDLQTEVNQFQSTCSSETGKDETKLQHAKKL